jgi:hypothetical protein
MKNVKKLSFNNEDTPVAYLISGLLDSEFARRIILGAYDISRMLQKEDNTHYIDINDNETLIDKDGNALTNLKGDTYGTYCDPISLSILRDMHDLVQSILEEEIEPSYSYTRIYQKGSELVSHRDRSSCEISVSLNLAGTCKESFYIAKKPILKCEKDDIIEIKSNPGDAIIFFGSNEDNGYWHWRPELTSEFLLQTFLHYVKKDGKYSEYAYEWTKQNDKANTYQ